MLGYSVTVSTTVFEIVSLGSSPDTPANLYHCRIVENTRSYEVRNGGSIPSGGANIFIKEIGMKRAKR